VEGAQASEKSAISERDQLRTERDQLRNQLTGLKKENVEIRKQHPILEFYGPRAKYTASYDLSKEVGSKIYLGPCPREPCIILTVNSRFKGEDGTEWASLGVGGKWGNIVALSIGLVDLALPLDRGCKAVFDAGPYQVTFLIEDSQINSLQGGVGITMISFSEGLRHHHSGC
jgi:hypothetical protein